MIKNTVNLSEKYPECTLDLYIHDEPSDPRQMMIICPGGGYSHLSVTREGSCIAERYYDEGFNACVLKYSIAPNAKNYAPQIEVGLAVKYVRENAESLNVATNKIFTCGFSAGGHLAASAGLLWNVPEVLSAMGDAPVGISKPDGMILCYPVVSSGKWAHRGSIANLVGKSDYSEKEGDAFSLEKHVTPDTPPMFIWHTVTDNTVPVLNSTMLINAYLENGVSFEAHVYPKGRHGLALADEETCGEKKDPHVATWFGLSVEWVKSF